MADVIYDHLNINGDTAKLYAPGVLTGLSQTTELVGIEQEIADVRLGSGWVSPDDYGAVGDGETDDTQAVRSAFETGLNVSFGKNKTYLISGGIYIRDKQSIDLNGATIESTVAALFRNYQGTDATTEYNGNGNFRISNGTIVGGEVLIGHGHDIIIQNVRFRNSLGSHSIQVMSTHRFLIDNCSFAGLTPNPGNLFSESINLDPCSYTAFNGYGEGSAAYDGTPNKDITISNCYFEPGNSENFSTLVNAIGGHYYEAGQYQTGIKIINNVVDGATGSGFRTYGFRNTIISGNVIKSSAYSVIFGYGDCVSVFGNEFIFTGVTASDTRAAVELYGDESNLSVFDNVHRRYGSQWFNLNDKNVTFMKVDPVLLASGAFATGTDIPLDVPYTTFDTLIIVNGYVSSNSVRTSMLRCWPSHVNLDSDDYGVFRIPPEVGNGDEWPIDGLADGAVVALKSDGRTIQVANAGSTTRWVLGCRRTK